MKKWMTILACLFITSAVVAQEDTEAKSDTTKVKFGDVNVIIVDEDGEVTTATSDDDDDDASRIGDKEELTHWAGIDAGVNMLMNSSGSTSLPEGAEWLETDPIRSMSWSFNLFEQKIRIVKDYVGVMTGLGITYNSYGLKNNVQVLKTDSMTTAVDIPDSLFSYDKNKLRATYLRVPLMLEFNTSNDPDRTFHVAAGVTGGLRIGSITKQEYKIDGAKHKDRIKDDFNLNPFMLDASVRVGYRDFTIWANYGLTSLFEEDKGPEVYPLAVGITIVPF
ncbi:outer membrane beta-barrel protein [Sanyastnella coralliicola]|uniref:outer membrane beta-barrel protein n=1 Tax=Sanyastnella coralliicola TaxID=3069118 RepID=UPI0027B9B3C3|nr:outer membrane beta-barrel protein [Longitalea sp. SCSIO 12813]